MAVQVSYESKDVEIPEDYLQVEPHDARAITLQQVDFENSVLPEYAGAYAVVLDHVLSPSECAKLVELAAASVLDRDRIDGSPWRPALVNVGGGWEVLEKDYRNSDRIIWDNQTIVDRMWTRIEKVPGIKEHLTFFNEDDMLGGRRANGRAGSNWAFHRVNQRLRFLKYGGGQFFRPHCDGAYGERTPGGKILRTHFTVHLYLNDSLVEAEPNSPHPELVGGATSFLSSDEERRMDINPKAGRVLIFQHKRLYHCGDEVEKGIKYTVRTDIMYELKRLE
jgi:hypothetical protein